MFAAVTLFVGTQAFIRLAFARRDVRALAAMGRLARGQVAVLAFATLAAGVVFGLLTAAIGGFDFFSGWLIAAYVLLAGMILVNLLRPDQACVASLDMRRRRTRGGGLLTRSNGRWGRAGRSSTWQPASRSSRRLSPTWS